MIAINFHFSNIWCPSGKVGGNKHSVNTTIKTILCHQFTARRTKTYLRICRRSRGGRRIGDRQSNTSHRKRTHQGNAAPRRVIVLGTTITVTVFSHRFCSICSDSMRAISITVVQSLVISYYSYDDYNDQDSEEVAYSLK